MDLDLVAREIKRGAFERALLRVQDGLAKKAEPRARDFLIRSKILRKLGEQPAADADLKRALIVDPLDPEAQLAGCRSWPAEQHRLALRLLGNRYASKKHRMLAAAFLDAKALPLGLTTSMGYSTRVSIIRGAEQKVSVHGLQAEDRTTDLGLVQLLDQKLLVTDHTISERNDSSRTITAVHDHQEIFRAVVRPRLANWAKATAPKRLSKPRDLWIVIPVHNGHSVVKRCVESVLQAIRQTQSAKIIVVDDASTDTSTLRYLDSLKTRRDLEVIRCDENLGFVGAINTGLWRAGPGPVLLLNSDTYVPSQTLPRLLEHLRSNDVGTVTPFSNNGGSFSIPRAKREYLLPSNDVCEEIAETAFRENRGEAVDVLHGNGFAMLVSDACRQAVGTLSTEFESGYYEEVDFCLRARAVGFRNVCATDCFVGHEGAQSYGEQKMELAALNLRQLEAKYPRYRSDFERVATLDPLRNARKKIISALKFPLKKNPSGASIPSTCQVQLRQSDNPIVPVVGPFSTHLLDQCFDSIHAVSDNALKAHGTLLSLPHSFRFKYVSRAEPQEKALAFMENENVLALFDLDGDQPPTEAEYKVFEKVCLLKMKGGADAI